MAHATDVIGYTYEADMHCLDCSRARFGNAIDNDINPPEDSEGNPVHPIFDGNEGDPAGEYCGDCNAEIREPVEDWD